MVDKNNILLIITDQLSAQALPAWGNTFAKTPNINSIIERGVRFQNAYTPCCLCQPARAAFWTGLYPHQTGILSNGRLHPVPQLSESVPTLGSVFSNAGYRTVHFGKDHSSGALRGFDVAPVKEEELDAVHPAFPVHYDSKRDRNTRKQVTRFLSEYSDADPFLVVADLNNPHDICNWIGDFKGANPLVRVSDPLPPLPENLYHDPAEFAKLPKPVQYICCAHNRQAQIAEWDEEKIQYYLLAYHHYLSRVDTDIGEILAALNRRSDAERTLIVFMADHGDSMCGRWMATKHTSFYDETARVPLVFAGAGIEATNRSLNGIVSLLDLFPTLCEYSGIQAQTQQAGCSLMPWLAGDASGEPHPFVVSQWHTEWGFTIEPGRMIRTPRYKYTHYLEGDGEQLYDLQTDPAEMHNLVDEPLHQQALERHRALLREYVSATGDPYLSLEWKADSRWRKHPPGYKNHRGDAAPTAEA